MRLFGITMLAFILFQHGNAVGENQPIIRSAGTAGSQELQGQVLQSYIRR
jgi:hypothetical protein